MHRHRFYRARYDRRIAGVAAGFAEYFDLDPTLVRVAWFVLAFTTGFALLLYIALALIAPVEPAVPAAPMQRPPEAGPAVASQ